MRKFIKISLLVTLKQMQNRKRKLCVFCNQPFMFVCTHCNKFIKVKKGEITLQKRLFIPAFAQFLLNFLHLEYIENVRYILPPSVNTLLFYLIKKILGIGAIYKSIFIKVIKHTSYCITYFANKVFIYSFIGGVSINNNYNNNFITFVTPTHSTGMDRKEDEESFTPCPVSSKSSVASVKIFNSILPKSKRKRVKNVELSTDTSDSAEIILTHSASKCEQNLTVYDFPEEKLPPSQNKFKSRSSGTIQPNVLRELKVDSHVKPHTSENPPKSSRSFFRKLLPKRNGHGSSEKIQKNVQQEKMVIDQNTSVIQTMNSLSEEVYVQNYTADDANKNENGKKDETNLGRDGKGREDKQVESIPVASSYLSNPPLVTNTTLEDGLREVSSLASKLRESEAHLIEVITKYIKNPSFEKELLDSLTCHAKLHIEAERRAHKLANEMWLQQADLSRTQERALQDSLNTIVKQNRQLLEANENLMNKNEKLAIKYDSYCNRGHLGCSNQIIDTLSKNNESLRVKYISSLNKLNDYERELQSLQKRNFSIEQQLKNSIDQVQNYKALMERNAANHELEHAHLSYELLTNQSLIKETTEAGDVLLEDLSSLKNQMKAMSLSINWTKFKTRGRSLPDLFHMVRVCINELSKELITSRSQIVLKEKDCENIKTELLLMKETNDKIEKQKDELLKKIELFNEAEEKLMVLTDKNQDLEMDLLKLKNKNNQLETELDKAACSIKASHEEIARLNTKICEKESRLLELQNTIVTYKNEISSFNFKMDGFNKLIEASGSRELSRELSVMQEKLSVFQSQYFQILAEKNNFQEQLETLKAEKQNSLEYQKELYDHFKILKDDYELLHQSRNQLKEELEVEKSTVAALQSERLQYIEEKNVLTSIYQELSKDVNRVENLEAYVEQTYKEAGRLTLIAEYNKQIGEQLQHEVEERDKTITQLQKNIEKLSSLQIEQTKDNEVLCEELQNICKVKEDLNHRLQEEIQKCESISSYKEELDDMKEELTIMHEMQITERAALKQLLLDFEDLSKERDHLIQVHSIQSEQISSLTSSIDVENEKYQRLNNEYRDLREDFIQMQNLLYEKDCKIFEVQKQTEEKNISYENEVIGFKNTISLLRRDQNTMEENVQYLRNNLQKLTVDLNNAREQVVENKRLLEQEIEKNNELKQELLKAKTSVHDFSAEKSSLIEQITNLQQENDKIINEYEQLVNQSNLYENETTNEIKMTREKLEEALKEADILKDKIENSKNRIEHLERDKFVLDKENLDLQTTLIKLEDKARGLEQLTAENQDLNYQIFEHEKKNMACCEKINTLLKEIEQLEYKFQLSEKELENNTNYYKQCVEEMKEEFSNQTITMKNDLQNLQTKIFDLSNEIAKRDAAYFALEKAHREVAAKLLSSVRMCIDEKCARQLSEVKAKELSEVVKRQKSENYGLEEKNSVLSREQAELVQRISELNEDKTKLQSALTEAIDQNKIIKDKCWTFENEVKQMKQKCKDLSKTASEVRLRIQDSTEYKDIVDKLQEYEEKISSMKDDLEENTNIIFKLQKSLQKAQNDCAVMEFQKCEVVLRLHEAMGKLTTAENLNCFLKDAHQLTVSAILDMKDSGEISVNAFDTLISKVVSTYSIPQLAT